MDSSRLARRHSRLLFFVCCSMLIVLYSVPHFSGLGSFNALAESSISIHVVVVQFLSLPSLAWYPGTSDQPPP